MGGFADARDEIYGQVKVPAFSAALLSLLGYQPEIKFWGVSRSSEGGEQPPPAQEIFMSASISHGETDETLAGGLGSHSYGYQGIVTVQVFEPSRQDLSVVESVCELVRDQYRGIRTPGSPSVWFRDSRIIEVGQTPSGVQFNVTSIFQYSEVS